MWRRLGVEGCTFWRFAKTMHRLEDSCRARFDGMGGFLLSYDVDSQAFEPVVGHISIQHSHARNVKKDMSVNHLRCPRHGI